MGETCGSCRCSWKFSETVYNLGPRSEGEGSELFLKVEKLSKLVETNDWVERHDAVEYSYAG